jgi:hypothetical protein
MKMQSVLPAILLIAIASLSFGAHAEDTEKAPAQKIMKPHSHLEEKTSVAAKPKASEAAADEKSDKTEPSKKAEDSKKMKKNTNHFHPRDGK